MKRDPLGIKLGIASRLRFALWKGGSRRLFRKRGRSQFCKFVQNEFKNAFTTADSIRKHMREFTANPVVAQRCMPVTFQAQQRTLHLPTEIRSEVRFDID